MRKILNFSLKAFDIYFIGTKSQVLMLKIKRKSRLVKLIVNPIRNKDFPNMYTQVTQP